MSLTLSVGLVGVSNQSNLVFFFNAATTAPTLVASTKSTLEALRHGDAAKEAIGAAVHVIACHNVVRWREQVHNCRQCRAA
jgi:hypothetical protein